jgi:hypothetical protein
MKPGKMAQLLLAHLLARAALQGVQIIRSSPSTVNQNSVKNRRKHRGRREPLSHSLITALMCGARMMNARFAGRQVRGQPSRGKSAVHVKKNLSEL